MPSEQAKRLAALETVWRRQPPPAREPHPDFDRSRLTMREQDELDRILAGLRPTARDPHGLGALDDDELDRLNDLIGKAHGLEPSPTYFGMPHRDSGIGPCRCLACERAARSAGEEAPAC